MYDYIALIRSNPSPGAAAEMSAVLDDALGAAETSLVFLHGEGVDTARSALSDQARKGVEWVVCRTSWVRRQASAVPGPPLSSATLVTLFDALGAARRIDSFGLGGCMCWRAGADPGNSGKPGRLLLEIGFAPVDDRQHRETLEMALGAAALELDAAVLFQGEGLRHLEGEPARGWKQITDFGLMEMFVETSAARPGPEIGVQGVDAGRASQLRDRAATILLL